MKYICFYIFIYIFLCKSFFQQKNSQYNFFFPYKNIFCVNNVYFVKNIFFQKKKIFFQLGFATNEQP